jgi:hypothetical protein
MSHRRAARLVTLAAAVSSGLLAAALAAAPALADTPSAGCTGQSCWVGMASQFITLSGDYTNGPTGFAQVPVPPPPCWMSPSATGPQMYAAYVSGIGQKSGPSGQGANAGLGPFIAQIKKYRNSPGMWYGATMLTTGAGFACGNKLPLLAWVAPGAAPPAPPIPPATLAAYAYDHMRIPTPSVVVNPAGRNFVTLPAYVWAVQAGTGPMLPAGGGNVPAGGANMPAHLSITATAAGAGGASVTLTAAAGQLSVSAQNGATAYSPCPSPGGSKYPVGHPPQNSGPGTTPDCGVVFRAPSTGNTITASLLYAIVVHGANVQFAPIPVQGTRTVQVAEIQNLNK